MEIYLANRDSLINLAYIYRMIDIPDSAIDIEHSRITEKQNSIDEISKWKIEKSVPS